MDKTLPVSTLEYHDYAAMVIHMGSEPCRWEEDDHGTDMVKYFTRPNRAIAKQCREYLTGILRNHEKYYGNKKRSARKARGFLYNPASFVSFGAATDNLSVVAVDDFDFGVSVTSQIESPGKQISLAFCPTADSIAGGDLPTRKCLCELQDICKGPREPSQFDLPHKAFFDRRPLAVVTYYRLSGLAAIGPAMLLQEAILKTMARRISESVGEMQPLHPIIGKKDPATLRCLFLDTQGWADLATCMFSNNFSVIAAVLTQLHAMTFNDVYAQAERDNRPELRKAVEEFKNHALLSRIAEIHLPTRANGTDVHPNHTRCPLGNNHIFSSTHSTASITHSAFFADPSDPALKYSGFVAANTLCRFSPGHIWPSDDIREAMAVNCLSNHVVPIDSGGRHSWSLFGSFDVSEESVFSPDSMRAIPLRWLLERIKDLRGWYRNTVLFSDDWPVRSVATNLFVPIPKQGQIEKPGSPDHVDFRSLLVKLRKHIFEDELLLPGKKYSPLSLNRLRQAIRELRIPAPLSSSIAYLFTDYARALSDCELFDNVLDLHDAFAAFYRVLTREMKSLLDRRLREEHDTGSLKEYLRLSFLSDEDINELELLVTLLENALHHRIRTPFAGDEWWQMPGDFRGELNKLVNSADVPLKCGLSVLRRILRGDLCCIDETTIGFSAGQQKSKEMREILRGEDQEEIRFRVGGASRLTHSSKMMTRRFRIGHRDVNFIAGLGLNINHLVCPAFLCAHLHETGHMVSELLRSGREDLGKYKWCPRLKKGLEECSDTQACFRTTSTPYREQLAGGDSVEARALRDRYDEIFAEMFVCAMVFADYIDPHSDGGLLRESYPEGYNGMRTYARYYLAMYFLDPISMSGEDRYVLAQMAEVLGRGFLASYPLSNPLRADGRGLLYEIGEYRLQNNDIDRAQECFDELLADAGSFFYAFQRFWASPDAREYVQRHFRGMFTTSHRAVCCIHSHVDRILKGVLYDYRAQDESAGIGSNCDPMHHWEVLETIHHAYMNGRPIIRVLYDDPRVNMASDTSARASGEYRRENLEKRSHLDAVFLVRHLLRFHIHNVLGTMDASKGVCHIRGAEGTADINEQLLDKFDSGLFSVDFIRRATFLKSRIAVIKTFWDLSANIRGRTLRRILEQHLHAIQDNI